MKNLLNIPQLEIKTTTEQDVALILTFIKALATHYQIDNRVKATEESLRKALFGERQFAQAIIGYYNQEAVAFALYFFNFASLVGKPGIFLESLYVKPALRQRGFGRAMIIHLAKLAKSQGFVGLEWQTPGWNDPAIQFYQNLGAVPIDGFTAFKITDESLNRLIINA